MMHPFVARRQIRFADCDPAGIAYYPRLFELCDGAVEDWCESVLVPRRVLHLEMGLALPTVELQATFKSPCHLGEELDMTIGVHSIGRTSFHLSIVADCGREVRFLVRYTQVLMSMIDERAVVWPDEWRARIETLLHLNPEADPDQ